MMNKEYFEDWLSENKFKVLTELAIQRGTPTDKDSLCLLEEDEWEEMIKLAKEIMQDDLDLEETNNSLIRNKD